ncbi:MAG TPA: PHP domain-containing protein, partial [Nitrospiria bacterium]
INADLRVVSDKEFPFALHHFTGSKEHNVAMRGRAQRLGYKMNEYGLFKGKKAVACRTEEDIFEKLGLSFIPPEMREDRGEIESAERKTIPALIVDRDIRGIFHNHTLHSDGSASVEEMVKAARAAGYDYIGLSDHSRSAGYAGGLDAARVRKQHQEIDAVQKKFKDITIFKGIESDILKDGSLDYPDKVLASFDFVIASVHSNFNLSRKDQTARVIKAVQNPYTTMLGHPTGRLLLTRDGFPIDLEAVIDAAADCGVVMELNANPMRLDLDWRILAFARERKVPVSINPDAHSIEGIGHVRYGVGIARKGWLTKKDVFNAKTSGEVRKALDARRR